MAVPAERARGELRAAGEAVRTAAVDPAIVLSPQELQIARMAADGLSNRDIGSTLYLSHRTIGSHLYRIFPKLGVASRGELRALLAQ
jgi:DNA-binding NarL/FixJ family response regulator